MSFAGKIAGAAVRLDAGAGPEWSGAAAQPFTAPAVRPLTNNRIVNRKINTSGIEAMVNPAII